MTVAQQHVLQDTTNFAILLLAVAFLVRRFLASMGVELPTRTHGKVSTLPYEAPELALVLGLVAVFYATVRHPQNELLKGGIYVAFFLVLLLLTARRNDLAHVFGLHRLGTRALIMWSLLACFLTSVFTLLVMQLWQIWIQDLTGPLRPQSAIQSLKENPMMAIPIFVVACIMAPLSEEVVFRGFLYPTLKRHTQPFVAVVVVGAIFSAIHLNLPALAPLFLFSCLLIAAYELTGNLWVPILAHAGFNALNIGLTLLVPHGG
ncbi:MAG: CPBP family intramembrane glutamic endopeptidase [Verrucomicrobiota bacterium]